MHATYMRMFFQASASSRPQPKPAIAQIGIAVLDVHLSKQTKLGNTKSSKYIQTSPIAVVIVRARTRIASHSGGFFVVPW